MSTVRVDTDVVSYLFKRDSRGAWYRPRLARQLKLISFMTVAELDNWALARRWGQTRRADMDRFLQSFQIQHTDRDLCRLWAEIIHLANRQGRPILSADAWIAATALRLGIPLVTHNASDFAAVVGLEIITENSP